MYNKDILDKARKIESDVDYVDTCLHAGICPTCGTGLKLEEYTETSEIYTVFPMKKKEKIVTYNKVVCPEGHQLLHPKYGDRSSTLCLIWSDCINQPIRQSYFDA